MKMINLDLRATYDGMSCAEVVKTVQTLRSMGFSDEEINEMLEKNKVSEAERHGKWIDPEDLTCYRCSVCEKCRWYKTTYCTYTNGVWTITARCLLGGCDGSQYEPKDGAKMDGDGE